MTRDIRTSRRPLKVHSFSKKRPDRARRKAHSHDKVEPRAINDVYEYAPSKVRRAKVALSLDRHEIDGRRYGSDNEIDLSGLGQQAMEKLRARLMRDDADGDEPMESGDDEDIDSEDAFEESDRDKFAGSGFVRKGDQKVGSRKHSKRYVAKEVDLNEDSDALSGKSHSISENEEEGDEEMDEESTGEFFDVLDIFDGRGDVENDRDSPSKVVKEPNGIQIKVTEVSSEGEWRVAEDADVEMNGDDTGDEEEEGSEDDDDSAVNEADELRISASDSEDPSPEALADLETFLSNLEPTETHKRKPDEITEPLPVKRRRVADRTEAGEENEFGIRGSSTLKLDDLLAPLESSSALSALKRSTKPLTSSSSKTKTLAAPLPQRAQERLDREAAYEQTKEEVDKWSATMKRIKEAEHLSFPLQAEKSSRVSNLELAAKFTPSNELESAVDKLLKSAQLRDEDIARTEALKMAHLTVEEVAARRAELRTMRELAFRADRKAKRIAKIKSKTYRRIRKKQRERLDGPDGDVDADEEGEEGRLKAEVQRAKERATLRHKNTGKWAKQMHDREGLDQDQRQAIGEMLERGEKLRRRIHGENSGDEGSEDSESDDEEQDEETIKRGVFEELTAVRTEDDANLPDLKSKSVFNMKFMRDAVARQSREADAQAEEFEREMGFGICREEEDDDDGTDTVTGIPPKGMTMMQRTGGRLSFRPGTMPSDLRPIGSLASDTSSVTLQSTDLFQDMPAPDPTPIPSVSTPTPITTGPMPNPWLVPTASSGPSRKRNEVRVHKGADALAKSSNKLKKQVGKHEDEKERARDDAVLEIDANDVLSIPVPPASSVSGMKSKQKVKQDSSAKAPSSSGPTGVAHDEGDESDVLSEVEEQERLAERKKGKGGKGMQAFQQRDLVALAFAGDNVVQAFEEAKRQETEADAPREVDTALPGWGSWGGTGTKKQPPKPHLIKSVPGVDPTARADHSKPHLIISERRDKKAAKYLVRELPYPYTSHAQFERRMETPLGTEWNTRVGFQRATLPRVVKKMGTVINPLERLF